MVYNHLTRRAWRRQARAALKANPLSVSLNAATRRAKPLLDVLWSYRRNARPGYPLKAMWRASVAAYLLNLPSVTALKRRLDEDPELRRLCGMGNVVPHRTTFVRFYQRLACHTDEIEAIMVSTAKALREFLPDLGEVVAVDSTAIRSHSSPRRKKPSDKEARWGVKHTPRAKTGDSDWFFGFKAHVLADTVHGIPLAVLMTPGNTNDMIMLTSVVEKTLALHDWWKPRILVADRGYDSGKNNEWLAERDIIPVILTRRPPNGALYDGIYTYEGIPTCLSRTPMKYIRTDPETGNHLYRCDRRRCRVKKTGGRTTRYCDAESWENPADNVRLFGTKIRRGSSEWNRTYRKRGGIERTFKSMKESLCLERHYLRGLRRITLHTLMSMLAFHLKALTNCRMGDKAHVRWMTTRVA